MKKNNRKKTKIKYPKLLLLLITFVAAWFIFAGKDFLPFFNSFLNLGYYGTFLAGVFFTYGFTAAPATAALLIVAEGQNLWLAGFIAGLGALIGDLIIFKFIRCSFADEIKKLSREKSLNRFNKKIPGLFKKYFIPVLAGFIIASPLPDEIGVSLLAASKSISIKLFSVFSYTLNTAGIFAILMISKIL